ncbi:MAG: hypothetical protein KDD94_01670 [Calditrichaeota bacterium]|nr:hypothetical protein [Calditrichota bacterium]
MTHESSVLVARLAELQVTKTNSYYASGLWPCQRYNSLFRFSTEDNNLFISASIVYILQSVYKTLDLVDQKKVDQMVKLFIPRISEYRNKDNKASYNFWRTRPSQHFPYGMICRHLDFFRLPDDADDSSLVFLIDPDKKSEFSEFKALLAAHANIAKKRIRKVDSRFRNLPAYTTFFAERMPNEFDLCVQSNILSVFYQHQQELDEHSEATWLLIKTCIQEDLIRENAFQLSPNYGTAALIYYHICRLLYYSTTSDFDELIPLLKSQVIGLEARNLFDRLLKGICMKMLGLRHRYVDFDPESKSAFFIAGMFSAFDNPLAQMIAPWQFTHVQFRSVALNTALLLQYHCLD